jgi:hypothetical protein
VRGSDALAFQVSAGQRHQNNIDERKAQKVRLENKRIDKVKSDDTKGIALDLSWFQRMKNQSIRIRDLI